MHEILYCEPDSPTLAAAPGSYNPDNRKHIDSDVQKNLLTQKCAEFCTSTTALSTYLAESVDLIMRKAWKNRSAPAKLQQVVLLR